MMAMRVRTFNAYFKQIVRIEAWEDMRATQVVTTPNLKPDEQRDIHQQLARSARGEEESVVTVSSNAELQRILRGGR